MEQAGVQSRKQPSRFKAAQPAFAALSPRFFNRDAAIVARALLGKLLVRRYAGPARGAKSGGAGPQGELLIGRVVEAEAYLGEIDPGSHAFNGKTPRNAVLFGPPGIAYVYFIYGNHYCLNVSCRSEGHAEGVLFRALEPVSGVATMARLRGLDLRGAELCRPLPASTSAESPSGVGSAALRLIASGPGRLAQAMAITRQAHNGMALTDAGSELFLADDGWRPARIAATPRINVTKAADRLLRFVIAGNQFVSAKRVD